MIAASKRPVKKKYSALDLCNPIRLFEKPCTSANSYQMKGSVGLFFEMSFKISSASSYFLSLNHALDNNREIE